MTTSDSETNSVAGDAQTGKTQEDESTGNSPDTRSGTRPEPPFSVFRLLRYPLEF
ncbi:MAG: hypothetical protein WBS20_15190 [Lysobacterales bacterium]